MLTNKLLPQVECQIDPRSFDLAALRASVPKLDSCGGFVAFEGIVRNINHGKEVTKLVYEAYEELALKELRRICDEAIETRGVSWIRAVHRTGMLEVGETAVVIQVLSRHRAEAFDACQYVIDQLKIRVPIWKKEFYSDETTNWTRCSHTHPAVHEQSRPL